MLHNCQFIDTDEAPQKKKSAHFLSSLSPTQYIRGSVTSPHTCGCDVTGLGLVFRVLVTFHLSCVHNILSSVLVAEWQPFENNNNINNNNNNNNNNNVFIARGLHI